MKKSKCKNQIFKSSLGQATTKRLKRGVSAIVYNAKMI